MRSVIMRSVMRWVMGCVIMGCIMGCIMRWVMGCVMRCILRGITRHGLCWRSHRRVLGRRRGGNGNAAEVHAGDGVDGRGVGHQLDGHGGQQQRLSAVRHTAWLEGRGEQRRQQQLRLRRHGPPHLMRLLRVQLSPGRVELALEFPRCGGRYTHINHGQRSLEFYVGGRGIFFLLRVRRMTGSYTQLQKSGRNHVLADFENVGKIANKDDVGVGERVGAERTLDLFESAGDEKER